MNEISPSQIIAYFSMEIGLESSLPSYSGDLGMLQVTRSDLPKTRAFH